MDHKINKTIINNIGDVGLQYIFFKLKKDHDFSFENEKIMVKDKDRCVIVYFNKQKEIFKVKVDEIGKKEVFKKTKLGHLNLLKVGHTFMVSLYDFDFQYHSRTSFALKIYDLKGKKTLIKNHYIHGELISESFFLNERKKQILYKNI